MDERSANVHRLVNRTKFTAIVTVAFCLGACTSAPTQPVIVDASQNAPIEREPIKTPTADEPAVRADPTAATASLLAAAQQARDNQDYDNAVTYLERAVRIDPRNAALWIELSGAHLADGDMTAANQHVRKAIALAGNDPVLTRQAWLQLANIREAEGNLSEAKAIRKRYASVRG